MEAPSIPPPETLSPAALPWWQRWRTTLLAVFVLVALVVGAVEIARTITTYRRAEQAALALVSETAATLAAATELFVARYTAIAETAAEAIFNSPTPLAPEARHALLAGIRRAHPEIGVVGIIDPSGRVIDALPIENIGLDVSNHDHFHRAAGGETVVAGDLLAGRLIGGSGTSLVATARNEDGSLAGMVLIGLPVRGLEQFLGRRLEGGAFALVVDRTGRVMVHGPHADPGLEARDHSQVPLVAEALAGQLARFARFPSPHTGEPVLGAMVPVPALGWAVGVVQPVEAALAPAQQQLRLSLASAATVLVLGIAVALLLSTWLSRPIADLAAGAAAIARGDLGHRVTPRGHRELRWLAEHFNRMAARLGEIGRLNDRLVVAAVNEQQRAHERAEEAEAAKWRFAFLAEASTRLAASLDYESTLANIARLAVPDLADYCVVDLLEPDRSTRRVAVAHGNPARAALASQLHRFPPDLNGPHPLARVMRSGRSEVFSEISDEALVEIASTPEHLRILRELGPKSDMHVPLVARGRTLGAITFVSAESGRRYGQADVALAEALAARAALAVDNARLYRQAQEAELRLRQQLDLTSTIISSLAEGLLALDADGRVTFVNPAAERILGWREAELRGRDVRTVIRLQRADGTRVAACDCPLLGALHDGVTVRRDDDILTRRDGTTVQVAVTGSPILVEGKIAGAVFAFHDITERRQAEEALRRSEEQLRQAQKMEAVGRLAGGIAHDFNNILTAITGYSELLLGRLGENGPLRRDAEEIRKAAERAAALTRQLLAFSRRQVLQPKVLDLNAVVAGMAPMLRRLIGENIELVTVTGEGLGQVKADPGLLEQVILNLAVNARDAMPQGGRLTIETANVELDGADARQPGVSQTGAGQAGPHVMLAVSDTGCGMDARTLEHLFEPFFTTKEVGQGTGLGLSTVYGIVQQSGGHIQVNSEVGCGSTFRIYFPRVEEPDAVPAAVETPARPAAGSETVLLVEDEEIVRTLSREVLGRAGYTVLEARDGREALAIAERHRGPIHVLLTDIVMPGMSGPETARHLTAARAGLKVLFMSGYTDNAIGRQGVLDAGTALLSKPFTPAELAQKIRELLEAPERK